MPFEAGSKLDDPALLALVEEFGLDETTYPALQFIPLLYIAWSDGKIQSGEARKIRKIANQRGLASGAVGKVLDEWLAHKPDDTFFQGGLNLFLRIVQHSKSRQEITDIISLCNEVAHCAGGLFGMAYSVSKEEIEALEEIENTLMIRGKESLLSLWSELDSAELAED